MYSYNIKSFSEKFELLLGKTGLMCLLVFLVNFILKLLYITAQPLSGDEPFSVYISQMDVGAISEQLFAGNNPPLYEIILHYWVKSFGIGVFSVRVLSVLVSSLTAVFIYKIGQRFFNMQTAVVASILFLFSNYHIFFSHEARCYGFFALFTAVSFYYFLKLLFQRHTKLDIVYYILANTLMMYLHYFSAWVLVSQGFAALLVYFIYHKNIKTIIGSNIVVLVLLTPALYILVQKITGNQNWDYSWLSKVTGIEPLYDNIWAFSNMPITAVCCLAVMFLFIVMLFLKKIIVSKEGLVVICWFAVIYLLMFLVSFKIPMFLNRYLMGAAIAFPLLVAYMANVVSGIRYLKYLYIILPIMFMVTVNFNADTCLHTDKMAEFVKVKKEHSKTITLLQPHWALLSFSYYYNRDIFKQYDEKNLYKNIEAQLNKQNIYGVNLTSDSVFATLNQYTKIVFIDTDHGTCFPGNNIQNMLGSKYKLISQNPDSLGFGYYIYVNTINEPQ